jgi:hypothetical protein
MTRRAEVAIGRRSENYWPLLRRRHPKQLGLLQKPWFSRICDVPIAVQSDFGRSGGSAWCTQSLRIFAKPRL